MPTRLCCDAQVIDPNAASVNGKPQHLVVRPALPHHILCKSLQWWNLATHSIVTGNPPPFDSFSAGFSTVRLRFPTAFPQAFPRRFTGLTGLESARFPPESRSAKPGKTLLPKGSLRPLRKSRRRPNARLFRDLPGAFSSRCLPGSRPVTHAGAPLRSGRLRGAWGGHPNRIRRTRAVRAGSQTVVAHRHGAARGPRRA